MRNILFTVALLMSMLANQASAQKVSAQTKEAKPEVTNGRCEGQIVFQRKAHGKDVVGYVAAFIGKLSKNDRVKVCALPKQFILPNTAANYTSAEFPLPPHIDTQVSVSTLPAAPMQFAAMRLPAPPSASKSVTKSAKNSSASRRPVRHKAYVVPLTISAETAEKMKIVAGDYPANYLENQKKDTRWGKRVKTVARVVETANGFACSIYLKSAPAKNSAVAIDFQNGNSIEVVSDMLEGEMVMAALPPKLHKKIYEPLKGSYQVKPPLLLSVFRFVLPVIPQAVMGTMAMGPPGAAMPVAGLVQGIAMRKIMGNQRTMAAVENSALHVNYVLADQSDKFDRLGTRTTSLEQQVNALLAEIKKLRQTSTTTRDAAKTAKTDKRRK